MEEWFNTFWNNFPNIHPIILDISRTNNYENKYHCLYSEVSFIVNRYWLLIVAHTVGRLSDTTDLEVLLRYTSGNGYCHDNWNGPSISSVEIKGSSWTRSQQEADNLNVY